ncbi:S1 RNA-binding domain-containing protein [Streptomyces mangrovisoli]|uniref:S1 motif domain-containing protein n=1 Tax=Streptomyces mangrovisoli TaxID=1428628 RepID=A0A1J4P4W4_9ACTN|nr:S1 RNA-binding domain-containing protein [Streptomyces mangrovisoli]OIJ69791.1 hypothetical protein WN71_000995 [Streptomyces mangrovisoli]
MEDPPTAPTTHEALTPIRVGDVLHGRVVAVSRSEFSVVLDDFPDQPPATVGALDACWLRRFADVAVVGQRVSGEVIAVDLETGRVRLSTAATEHPQLWRFLSGIRQGDVLTGTVAAIERFGVFVALDEGPEHPLYPGVGFLTYPELSWRRFEKATDVVRTGQRIACEFLQFDTWNGEARLSLRATQPDPFAAFADGIAAGRTLNGRVTHLVPFGVFVEVAEGVEGFIRLADLGDTPVATPEDAVQTGDEITVVVTDIDRERRRLTLSRRGTTDGPRDRR